MINRAEIKAEAKQLIRSGRVSPLIMTAVVLVIGFVLNRVVNLVTYGMLFPEIAELQYLMDPDPLYGMDPDAAMAAMAVNDSLAANFLSILVGLFTTVLLGGYYSYLMGIRQGWEMRYDDLFDGLSVAGKLIWCEILMGVRIFLWSLLFVIPGLVAVYRYRFAMYNIMSDESLSASEAIALSCKQTNGMKFDLLALDFSFFGWALLSVLTLNILDIWLYPYTVLCDLACFEEAQLRLGRSPYGGSSPNSQSSDYWG